MMKEDQKNKIPEGILKRQLYPLIRKPFMPVVAPHWQGDYSRAVIDFLSLAGDGPAMQVQRTHGKFG